MSFCLHISSGSEHTFTQKTKTWTSNKFELRFAIKGGYPEIMLWMTVCLELINCVCSPVETINFKSFQLFFISEMLLDLHIYFISPKSVPIQSMIENDDCHISSLKPKRTSLDSSSECHSIYSCLFLVDLVSGW